MTFVSYAQNFEDVMLWRALGHLGSGFYIDVGASHPDTDSVTRAFYDRGWRGINIEPTEASFVRLAAARPRDVNLRLAVGAAAGCATLHVVEGAESGLSTLDGLAASRYGGLGMVAHQRQVQVDTLASICRSHAPADIHVLKIDVEGAELAVLQGADFATYRPWIVLAEATAPMSTREVHAEWESVLLAADYRFVWFDGLNRFYVADERHAQLAPSFRTPPNVFDNFLRAADTEWTRRMQEAETRAATLLPRIVAAEHRAAVAEGRAEAAHLRLAQVAADAATLRSVAVPRQLEAERLGAEIGRLERVAAEAVEAAHNARNRAEQAERQSALADEWLQAMRRSTSWRLTEPLRRVARGRSRDQRADATPVSASVAAEQPAATPAPAAAVPVPPSRPASPPCWRCINSIRDRPPATPSRMPCC